MFNQFFEKNSHFNKSKKSKKSRLASQGLVAAVAGTLLLNEDAIAQIVGGVDVLGLDGIASAVLQDDNTLLVTLDSGQAYIVPVGGFEAQGSQFLVPGNFLDTLVPVAPAAPAVTTTTAGTGGANAGLIGLGIAALGGIAAAVAGGGGDDDDGPAAPPPPPPPPEPNEVPVVTVDSAVSVAENTTAVTSASATDANAGDTLTFSLTGTDAALFNIDSATGDITFAAAPDFESPNDAGGDNVFDITVNASDGTDTSSQDVAITVTDVNEAPVITSAAAVSVAENQTAALTAAATDQDGDALTFSLSGTDASLFAIDATTGVITFVGAPDFEMPGDAGADNVFDVTVSVTDGTATSTQDVAITVTNVNEAPAISVAPAVSITENTTAIATATASDIDGDALTFSVDGPDAAFFTVDSMTGAISFINAPDFENPQDAGGDNVYDIEVTASDGALTDFQAISVTVTDVNEAPVITSAAAVSVAENQTASLTATATDVDGDALTFSLSGTDAALFNIDAMTGAITFAGAPDFEMPGDAGVDNVFDVVVNVSDGMATTSQNVAITVTDVNEAPVITAIPMVQASENQTNVTTASAVDVDAGDMLTFSLTGTDAASFNINSSTGVITFVNAPDVEMPSDANVDNVFDIVATVSDGTLTDSQAIAVTVTDVNEAPVISSPATVSIAENVTAVQTAIATDVDGDALTFSLSGTDAALFNIDAMTGAVTFVGAPDFEMPGDAGADNVFDVIVNASDGITTTTQNLAVTVTNVNEAPVITAAPMVSVAENATTVTTATAADIDGDLLTFSLTGADASAFMINPTSGAITFLNAPNFEMPADSGMNNVFDIVATVSDGVLTNSQAIAVTVTDVNEAPVLPADATVSVAENQTAVITAMATDMDMDALTFSLSGTDAALFNIDAMTGAISFAAAPDFEMPGDSDANNIFDFTVDVTDGALMDSQNFMVTVTDAVEPNPVIMVTIPEEQIGGVEIDATSLGATITGTLSGPDAAFFGFTDSLQFSVFGISNPVPTVMEQSFFDQVVAFINAPDFEMPSDANGDNVFEFTVTVSTPNDTIIQPYEITVLDVGGLTASPEVEIIESLDDLVDPAEFMDDTAFVPMDVFEIA